jgi:hypothetical protein
MHMSTEWNNVVFLDEKKFYLDGLDGFSSYWHDLCLNNPPRMSRNSGGGAVMVRAAFSAQSKTPICWITTKMDSRDYSNLLDDVLIKYLDEQMNENAIFLLLFTNRGTRWNSLQRNQFQFQTGLHILWTWTLWGILAHMVYKNGRHVSSWNELKVQILKTWRQIASQTLETLVKSLPGRIFAVIYENEGAAKYWTTFFI